MPTRTSLEETTTTRTAQPVRLFDGGPENTVTNRLCASPRLPAFDRQLPKSFRQLLAIFNNQQLGQYRHADKAHWPSALQTAYGRRLYLYDAIGKRAVRQGVSKEVAADLLDAHRKGQELTMSQYMVSLKANDKSTQ